MTRIFDALRKVQATPPAAPPAVPETPRTTAVGRAAARASAIAAPPAPVGAAVPAALPGGPPYAPGVPGTLPYAGPAELPDDLVRELMTLRMALESSLSDRRSRSIAFVGSLGAEGTSTVALQFALTVARDPLHRVVLVDANAMRPARYAAADHPASPRPPLERATRPGPLHLLPLSETHGRDGSITTSVVREALDMLTPAYDWIVLDGPAALESPDAAPIAALADGTVIIVQSGRTKRPVLARSVDLLRKAGATVVGTVLNRRRLEIPDFIYRRI
jgi:Mrp family chromosome partitioning ATPase